jgi:FtsZ-binding cell division protein ZapB
LNAKYQNEFSQFLITKFSNEYIQTGNVKTLEEMLFTIRQKKEQYKQKFAEDINEIRDQNKTLVDRNNQLAQSNQLLQEQLKAIQEKLVN